MYISLCTLHTSLLDGLWLWTLDCVIDTLSAHCHYQLFDDLNCIMASASSLANLSNIYDTKINSPTQKTHNQTSLLCVTGRHPAQRQSTEKFRTDSALYSTTPLITSTSLSLTWPFHDGITNSSSSNQIKIAKLNHSVRNPQRGYQRTCRGWRVPCLGMGTDGRRWTWLGAKSFLELRSTACRLSNVKKIMMED